MKNDDLQGVREPGVQVTKRPDRSAKKPSTAPAHVHKGMTVSDILVRYPQSTTIMAEYGLHCFGCSANDMETLEEGCLGHGFESVDIDNLITDINEMIESMPPRPETLTITEEAAKQIGKIAAAEGKADEGLSVLADEHGGFFMEFRKDAERGEKIFQNDSVPEVKIFASTLTLQRIGGATIDYRDDRFKLDVEDAPTACACGGKCDCT